MYRCGIKLSWWFTTKNLLKRYAIWTSKNVFFFKLIYLISRGIILNLEPWSRAMGNQYLPDKDEQPGQIPTVHGSFSCYGLQCLHANNAQVEIFTKSLWRRRQKQWKISTLQDASCLPVGHRRPRPQRQLKVLAAILAATGTQCGRCWRHPSNPGQRAACHAGSRAASFSTAPGVSHTAQ